MKVAIRRGRVITVGDKYILKQSTIFDEWLNGFTDRKTQGRIRNRIDKARAGNFGKVESVRDGVFEMQLHFGPGYRIYFFQLEKDVYWLLCGGDKSSQVEDVKLAKMLKREPVAKRSFATPTELVGYVPEQSWPRLWSIMYADI